MATVDSDTFTRANQSGWGTASSGSVWAHPGGPGTLSISSNEGVISGASNEDYMLLGTGTQGDTEAVVRFSTGATSTLIGMMLRSNSTATTSYFAFCLNGTFRLTREVSGTFTTLLNTAKTITTGFWWMRFRVTGSTSPLLQARVWQDGTTEGTSWDFSATDTGGSVISGAGQFGLTTTFSGQFDSYSVNDTQSAVTHLRISDGYGGVFS